MKIMRALLLSVLGIGLLTACSPSSPASEEDIRQAIAAANRCDTAEDCVLVGSKCPFDCYIYAHRDEAENIRTMVGGFSSDCTYSCIASEGVECLSGKCVTIPQGPERQGSYSSPAGSVMANPL